MRRKCDVPDGSEGLPLPAESEGESGVLWAIAEIAAGESLKLRGRRRGQAATVRVGAGGRLCRRRRCAELDAELDNAWTAIVDRGRLEQSALFRSRPTHLPVFNSNKAGHVFVSDGQRNEESCRLATARHGRETLLNIICRSRVCQRWSTGPNIICLSLVCQRWSGKRGIVSIRFSTIDFQIIAFLKSCTGLIPIFQGCVTDMGCIFLSLLGCIFKARLTMAETPQVLKAKERVTATSGEGAPFALEAEAHRRAEPPLLDQACIARAREREREIPPPLPNTRRDKDAEDPGSPVDGAGAARDDGDATRTTPSSAAAGSLSFSPEALRNTLNATQAEYSHDDGDGGDDDVQVSARLTVPGRSDWGHVGSLFEPGDELLVEQKLRRARKMPLSERRSRRYSKPQSFVCAASAPVAAWG